MASADKIIYTKTDEAPDVGDLFVSADHQRIL